MRAVVQRVKKSSVTVDGQITGSIEQGIMLLIGVEKDDTDKDAEYIAKKVSKLRIFDDENGVMNINIKDAGGDILAVSQFTLLGDVRKGNRPSYSHAEEPETADKLYRRVIELLQAEEIHVEEGVFQTDMLVEIHNNGPVTILLDSRKLF